MIFCVLLQDLVVCLCIYFLILANSILENILCSEKKEKIQIKLLSIGSATQMSSNLKF